MTLFFQKATAASGTAKEAIICGTIKALLHDIGMDSTITDEMIAHGCPSENTIANWELDMATCCTAVNIYNILQESLRRRVPVVLGLMTDHTNKQGKGFFAKVISWCSKQADDWSLNFFCLDIDNCDHTVKGAARAVQLALWHLGLCLGVDIIIKLICGDSGGGAAVQHLCPELKAINVMFALGRAAKCLMHALNKAFEMACLHCFGKQGVNVRSMTQMFWLVVQMFQRIKMKGGTKYFDYIYAFNATKRIARLIMTVVKMKS